MQFWDQSRADGNVLDSVIRTLKDRYGLLLRSPDRANLEQFLARRSAIVGGWGPYGALIAGSSPASVAEWHRIIGAMTNTESYFFRDRGQFTLLEQTLLPALIAERRSDRQLRLWSAACASGEEAYSLAILLCELIPDLDRWQVMVMGTDINTDALARAERGWFREWSFRAIDPHRWQHYFEPIADGWQIATKVRQLVTFCPFNLARDAWMSDRDGAVDLILCRNVFIYFDPQAITPALSTFAQALKPGGYLLTGHAELYGQNLGAFDVQLHPQSVVYRRPLATDSRAVTGAIAPVSSLPVEPQPPIPLLTPALTTSPLPGQRSQPQARGDRPPQPLPISANSSHQPPPHQARQQPGSSATTTAIGKAESAHPWSANRLNFADHVRLKLEELLKIYPASSAILYALACLHANIGASDQALDFCQKALDLDPNSIEICCLMARIWEEQNDLDRAKQCLRRAIYLDREAVHPKLELASLYDRTGDPDLANRLYRAVLTFIDQPPPLWSGVTGVTRTAARALADHLRHRLLADPEPGQLH
jgi:chemotaxis protein methyltransferase CheR